MTKDLDPYIIIDSEGEKVAIKNEEYWKKLKKEKYDLLLRKSKIPENYWDINFDDYIGDKSRDAFEKTKKYAINCNDEKFHNINMYLVGENSCQKTMLMCNIGKEFLRQGFTVRFIQASDLIDLLLKSQGFSYIRDIEEQIKDYTEADLILIDDIFDKRKSTYWNNSPDLIITAWDKFLRKQIAEDRRIILTSNYSTDHVKENFGESMYNLIHREFYQLYFYDNINIERRDRFEGLFE